MNVEASKDWKPYGKFKSVASNIMGYYTDLQIPIRRFIKVILPFLNNSKYCQETHITNEDGTEEINYIDKQVEAVKESVESAKTRVSGVKGKALGKWNELEEAFDKRLNSAISRLGVPSRNEVKALQDQVETLTAQIEKLTGTTVAAAKPAAKKAVKAPAKPAAKAAAKAPAKTAAKPAAKAPAKPAAKKPAAAKPAAKAAADKPAVAKEAQAKPAVAPAAKPDAAPVTPEVAKPKPVTFI